MILSNFDAYISTLRRLKKITYYFIVILLAILFGGALGVYIYKDDIIDLLIEEVNKSLKTQLEVEQIDLNLLKGFPNLAVEFKGVKFHSAFENEMLLSGDNVFFVLNIWNLLEKNIEIERLEVDNGKLIIHKNKKGENNFDVFNVQDASDTTRNSLEIRSILLTNVEVVYNDEISSIHATYAINKLLGSAKFHEPDIDFYVQSNFLLTKTSTGNLKWLIGKKVQITTRIEYNGTSLSVFPSELSINQAYFKFNGHVKTSEPYEVSIRITGEKNDFSSMVSILPDIVQKKLKPFNGKGKIDFITEIKGAVSRSSWPKLTTSVGLTDFVVNHKELKEPLYLSDVKGYLAIMDLKKPETGHFELEKADASVKDKKIKISGSVNNFQVPTIRGRLNGELDVPWILSVAKLDLTEQASGFLGVDMEFSFTLQKGENTMNIKSMDVAAQYNFHKVGFHLKNYPGIRELEGRVLWKNGSAIINAFKGQFGQSDIELNGTIDHLAYLLGDREKEETTASLQLNSAYMNLDEIVDFITRLPQDTTAIKGRSDTDPYIFDLELSIDTINFRKFFGTNLRARTQIEPKKIMIEKLTSNGFGGKVAVAGSISRQFNGDFFIMAKTQTNSIELDSLFNVFNNFQQDFITDEYLKGQLNSDVYTYMYFDKDWRFRRNLLYVEALLQIKKGELNNFEPIMALAPYLNNQEEKLSRLKFSDLNSHIDIANDTVFLSDMYVGTNVRNIKIGGYHTLDQHIDYRLSVPVINDKRDKDQEFGEVKVDKEGKLYWPFRIKGTTDDYKVNYDIGRAGSNIVKGLKREITEFGNTLTGKKKEEKKDTLLLEDDEYFEWENE